MALSQLLSLGRRSVLGVLRKPTSYVPSLSFPLLFLALTSSALERSTTLPGFPAVDSFLQFAVATTVIQGTLFGAINAGSGLAEDIEGGFFERLIASPVARTSILAGRVAAAATLGFIQAWLFFAVTTLFGLEVEGGFVAMLAVALVAAAISAGIGSLSVALALRTGSAEAVDGSFPLLFALLFLSSAYFPRSLMNGWFGAVASINPMSHMIEGLRSLIISHLNPTGFFVPLSIAMAIFGLGLILDALMLRRRLAEAA